MTYHISPVSTSNISELSTTMPCFDENYWESLNTREMGMHGNTSGAGLGELGGGCGNVYIMTDSLSLHW